LYTYCIQGVLFTLLQNMAVITVASHRKVVAIENLQSIFALQFTLPYFM